MGIYLNGKDFKVMTDRIDLSGEEESDGDQEVDRWNDGTYYLSLKSATGDDEF